jgi:predicted transporter
MANKVVSLIILIVGISMGLGIGFHLFTEAGWAVFFIAVLLAFLNYKKNPFKL